MKQVIIVRKDLGMRKGKMCAQAAHASLSAVLSEGTSNPNFVEWYHHYGQRKIVVSVNSEEELRELYSLALTSGLMASIITDAGHTEFKVPTITAVAIGPGSSEHIDKITGNLPLI